MWDHFWFLWLDNIEFFFSCRKFSDYGTHQELSPKLCTEVKFYFVARLYFLKTFKPFPTSGQTTVLFVVKLI